MAAAVVAVVAEIGLGAVVAAASSGEAAESRGHDRPGVSVVPPPDQRRHCLLHLFWPNLNAWIRMLMMLKELNLEEMGGRWMTLRKGRGRPHPGWWAGNLCKGVVQKVKSRTEVLSRQKVVHGT